VTSGRNRFEEGVLETLASLSNDQLIKITQAPHEYTPFAITAARRELARRRSSASDPQSATDDLFSSKPHSTQLSGCYVELWRDAGFEGESLRIQGPAEYDTLTFDIVDWSDDVGSIRVGPNAFIEAFDAREFGGRMVCFGPNQEVADLSDFNFNNEIESIKLINSMKILCAPREGPECDRADAESAPQERSTKQKLSGKKRRKRHR